jgi:D-alanyl-D-alanine carboxypeptidase/D-alanyl-D-alanine-endopeptidase (penicillin-binding protein 4)
VRGRLLLAGALLAGAVGLGSAAVASERDDLPSAAELPVPAPSPITPLLSARRVPGVLAAPVADRRLAAAIEPIIARQRGDACLTVATAGRTIYTRNAEVPLTPASVEKLVTALAALEVLGPDFRYVTRVVAAAPPVDGVVAGDLFVVGSGDPLLNTAAYAARFRNQPQTRTPVEDLAAAIAGAGVTRVEGRVVGDESRFDADRYPDPWPERFVTQDQSGPLSALTVNDAWAAFPPGPDTRVPDETPAPDPPLHAAGIVAGMLGERGIVVTGGAASGPAPAGAVEIATLPSPPLSEVVGQMLRESDNQTAELLLKELAVARGRPGTSVDGAAVAAEVMAGLALADPAPLLVDGSGLAVENRLTCELVQAVLDLAGPGSPIDAGLPVAGQSGTLALRFLDPALVGRLRAKTGTLNQVTALAGFLDTTPGARLTFSLMVNLPPGVVVDEEDLLLQEELARTMARYPEGPSLDELGPQPVVVEE